MESTKIPISYLKNIKLIRYYKLVGEYLGYPSCCINEFLIKSWEPNWYCYKEQYLESHGFIPCDKCIERIKSGEITTKDLITNRKAPSPYPIYTDKENEEFIKINKIYL